MSGFEPSKLAVTSRRTTKFYSHPSLLNKEIHQNTKYNLQNYMYIKIANMSTVQTACSCLLENVLTHQSRSTEQRIINNTCYMSRIQFSINLRNVLGVDEIEEKISLETTIRYHYQPKVPPLCSMYQRSQ